MGEANEKRNRSREMRNLSLEIEKYPRDLLQRFMSNTTRGTQQQSQEEDTPTTHSDEEIELNLGLSLGGRFGVDKNDKKKLLRSSSIAGSIPIFREIGIATPTTTITTNNTPAVMYPPLIRTSSLPTETEEEWRKRKELQTLRRMEAKRRRSEKQRNYISSSNASNSNPKMELSLEEEKQISVANSGGGGVGPPFGMQSWAAAARQVILGGGGLLQGLVVQPCSQGSVESQGGTSSGTSELESKPLQGEACMLIIYLDRQLSSVLGFKGSESGASTIDPGPRDLECNRLDGEVWGVRKWNRLASWWKERLDMDLVLLEIIAKIIMGNASKIGFEYLTQGYLKIVFMSVFVAVE
ncbi:hypothetical protein EZV62_017946 [Acer yangbiense]|uniref:Ninja-family protein n=1 Tax=Acer yangbiense TaxID=1000413 RepID=A0A5C7HHX9_9ROSI|nr:hypothetical protein EZV62_017946 [Acer yangbiense]